MSEIKKLLREIPMPMTAREKLKLYQKILAEEFMRELHFINEALNDRAQFKEDFADKLIKGLKITADLILPFADSVGGEVVNVLTFTCLEYANGSRKERKFSKLSDLVDLNHFTDIRLLVERQVAPEAARWYEYAIVHLLADDRPLKQQEIEIDKCRFISQSLIYFMFSDFEAEQLKEFLDKQLQLGFAKQFSF